MRVRERRAGLATVVDDRPACSGRSGAAAWSASRRCRTRMSSAASLVVELVEPAVVVGRVDEHLVDAAGLGHHVHRAEVVDGEPVVAVERRVQVGDRPASATSPSPPRRSRAPARVDSSCAGAERARTPGIDLDLRCPRREVGRSLRPLGHDRDPPPGEWVETHLAHSAVQDSARGRGIRRESDRPVSACHLVSAYTVTCRGLVVLERVAVEVLPAVGDGEAGGCGHGVELARRARSGSTTDAAGRGRRRRTATNWPYARCCSGSCSEIDSTTSCDRHRAHGDDGRPSAAVVGHERLDDERAAGREAGGDGGEAGPLALARSRG